MRVSALRRHARFLLSFALGIALWSGSLASPLDGAMRALLGVNSFFACYLALSLAMILRTSPDDLRRHAEADDEGAAFILILAAASVAFSLYSIFHVLNRPSLALGEGLFALLAAPLGWATMHMLAAFRYAHLYYSPDPDAGLEFPGGTKKPSIGDFLYFAFTIGMTAQVSDVVVTDRGMRRVVLIHSIGSFFFNTVILALAVNAGIALPK
ncbi:DUF1345 domain-containing protein [bacterium]|nr:DUF1345 domain-containing protein [bacterium]